MDADETVAQLANFTPCDVSDGLVKFGIKDGGFLPNLTQYSKGESKTVAGKSYTVLYAPLDDPRPAVKGGYIDKAPRGSVIVMALPLECQLAAHPYVTINNAMYGGLMSTRAQYLQCNGSVIFGRVRDVDEHRNLRYPVFAYGTGTTAPGPVLKIVGVQVELEVRVGPGPHQVAKIRPNEVVVADENGVVRIPGEVDARALLEYIPRRVAADELVAQDIKQGKPANESQKTRRAQL